VTRAELEQRIIDTPGTGYVRGVFAALDAIRDATPDGPAQLAEALGLEAHIFGEIARIVRAKEPR
jgi:hypothetical protein